MLKLTYTEATFHMECLSQAPERLVALRVKLAMRLGQPICVQPGTASFLIPAHLPTMALLEKAIQQKDSQAIALDMADVETFEIVLSGTWIAEEIEAEAGVFVTLLNSYTESLVFNLWQAAYVETSSR
ncbi:MAG: hypothetical protein HC825_09165 [Oscillatoriales cyanobacterium RM1_1_9]|nr:hypothetical protein [Oscillatoriales cyanobacterium SM2_3_0]NJO47790.1 hypothetical protein [Oscillatoriales cyanobacterium RM2_1_1]NJO71791.1 hypothetical protein [Oscillatoriales cyanobacterium RM1_1_9]